MTDQNPRRAVAPAGIVPGDTTFDALVYADWDGDGPGNWRGDDTPHDNTRRAGFALEALAAFARATRGTRPRLGVVGPVGIQVDARHAVHVDAGEALGDLLGDLHHLCDALGLNFDELSQVGSAYYADELRGD